MERLDIYKKQLNILKNDNNKSEEWNKVFVAIGKKVFSEEIAEIVKYKIMLCLSGFEYLDFENNVYYFGTKNNIVSYLDYYQDMANSLKKVSIKFIVKDND